MNESRRIVKNNNIIVVEEELKRNKSVSVRYA